MPVLKLNVVQADTVRDALHMWLSQAEQDRHFYTNSEFDAIRRRYKEIADMLNEETS